MQVASKKPSLNAVSSYYNNLIPGFCSLYKNGDPVYGFLGIFFNFCKVLLDLLGNNPINSIIDNNNIF